MADRAPAHAQKAHAAPSMQRGVREELAFRRATQLKLLASELLLPLLCKPAGPGCDLTSEELEQWQSLKDLLLKCFPALVEPCIVSIEQAQTFTSRLSAKDAALAMLAIDYTRLVAFARALIVARAAAKSEQSVDEASRVLLASADAIASQLSPFSAVSNREEIVRILLALRTQAVLLLDEDARSASLDQHFGASSIFPAHVQNLGRAAAKTVKEELQGSASDALRKRYPYNEMLSNGIDFARAVYASLAERDSNAPALPPRARPTMILFSNDAEETAREEQVRQLLEKSRADEATLASSPWQARQNAPILGVEAYAKLAHLPAEVLDDLLTQITRVETPNGHSQYRIHADTEPASSSQADGSPQLRFGPHGGLQRTRKKRAFNVLGPNMLEGQSEETQIVFDSQAVAEAEKKASRRKEAQIDENDSAPKKARKKRRKRAA